MKEIKVDKNGGLRVRNDEELINATGTEYLTSAQHLIAQGIFTVNGFENQDDKDNVDFLMKTVMARLSDIAPRDTIEGMLATQMIGLHNAAMECFKRAMISEQSIESRNYNLNQANKLTRSYALLMDALNKHRGKANQRVSVEHVHVHEGGQAIVGNVNTSEGGGKQKTKEQPHAKQITDAPITEMPSQNPQRETVPSTSNEER